MHGRRPDMPNEFLGPFPPWCEGVHAPEVGWGLSQFHATEPIHQEVLVLLDGEMQSVAVADINLYPNATDPLKREAYTAVHFENLGAEMGPDDVEALAAKPTRIPADDRAAKAWRT